MTAKILGLLCLSVTLNGAAALADGAAAPSAASAPGGIRINIKNSYDSKIDFGPLGKALRDGADRAEGVLDRQGSNYVGTVRADVVSTQTLAGMTGRCGPETYVGWQDLKVTGQPVGDINRDIQTISVIQSASTGSPSNEYLLLKFVPETMTSQQQSLRRPEDMLPDLVVACHTLIDTLSGIAFLPLNDSRWTMEDGGYIIVLPSSGVLVYEDTTVPAATGATIGPFEAKKSIWTIRVERLPQ